MRPPHRRAPVRLARGAVPHRAQRHRKRAWLDLGIRSELGRGAAPGGAPRPLDRGWSGEKSFPAVPGMGTADPAPIHKDIDHYRHKEGKRTRKEAAHG